MGDRPLPFETSARIRSRMALVAAGLLLLFAFADLARGGPSPALTFGARLSWALALLGASHVLVRRPGPWNEALVTACFLVSVAALVTITVVAGPHTGSRAFLIVSPLVFAAFTPESLKGLLVASAAAIAGAAAAQLIVGAGGVEALMEALRATAAGVIAVMGALSARRIRDAEVALAEERARALEALARSERRQAQVEKLAAAGSRAAGVAHDMSNPLASIRCNLDWLREAADEGRLEADRDEVRQVIVETRECLDRLGRNLADFRTVARGARALAAQVEELAGPLPPAGAGTEARRGE